MSYTFTDRERVQAGDVVTWGSLGYRHEGRAVANVDGGLTVRNSGAWYPDFVSATRSRELPTGTVVLQGWIGVNRERRLTVERLPKGAARWGVKLDGKLVDVQVRRQSAERAVALAAGFRNLMGHDSAIVEFWDATEAQA